MFEQKSYCMIHRSSQNHLDEWRSDREAKKCLEGFLGGGGLGLVFLFWFCCYCYVGLFVCLFHWLACFLIKTDILICIFLICCFLLLCFSISLLVFLRGGHSKGEGLGDEWNWGEWCESLKKWIKNRKRKQKRKFEQLDLVLIITSTASPCGQWHGMSRGQHLTAPPPHPPASTLLPALSSVLWRKELLPITHLWLNTQHYLFLALWPAMDLYINHCLLQQEVPLAKIDSNINL